MVVEYSPPGVLVGGVGCGAWWVVVVLWVFVFLTRGSSVALLLLVVLGEEFVLVVPQVGCVDDLVEVLFCSSCCLSGSVDVPKWRK